jgi:hypothetical protein
VPIVLKSWSLSFLETSGPVQACNGIALPFTIYLNHSPRGAEDLGRSPTKKPVTSAHLLKKKIRVFRHLLKIPHHPFTYSKKFRILRFATRKILYLPSPTRKIRIFRHHLKTLRIFHHLLKKVHILGHQLKKFRIFHHLLKKSIFSVTN